MFVYCPDCKNHYDDSYQSPECAWSDETAGYFHHGIYQSKPVESHVANTRYANMQHRLGKGPNGGQDGSPPVAPPLSVVSTDPAIKGPQTGVQTDTEE